MTSIISKSNSERQNDSTRFNPDFFTLISSSQHGNVVARLPEEVPISISSEWESPLSSFGGLKTKVADFTLRETTGLTLKNQLFSSQIWSGSSPIEMTVPLEFYADRDPSREVIQPIIRLAKMALPRYNNNPDLKNILTYDNKQLPLKPLTAPGPTIFDEENEFVKSDEIVIQLGNFLKFKRVIITNININFNTRDLVGNTRYSKGKPLRASCELTFRTIQSLTGEDFFSMFII